MKGVILDCLKNMVSNNHGKEKWQMISLMSGIKSNDHFLLTQDFDDKLAISLIDSTCKVLNLTIETAAEAYGEYWMNFYASKIYMAYMANVKSSKELLLKLDIIHTTVTKNIPNSRPPKFIYEWKNEKTLLMTYDSQRNLIDLFIGLAKGVGKYFKENLSILKIGTNQVEIVFN
jgi:hypothetical protein